MNLTQAEYESLANLRYVMRRFLRFSEKEALRFALTPQHHQALLALRGLPEGRERATVGALAERLQIRPHSAVGLVDRLVTQGLVERQIHGADRRQVFVVLTEAGRDRLEGLSKVHREELYRIGPEIQAILTQLAEPGASRSAPDVL